MQAAAAGQTHGTRAQGRSVWQRQRLCHVNARSRARPGFVRHHRACRNLRRVRSGDRRQFPARRPGARDGEGGQDGCEDFEGERVAVRRPLRGRPAAQGDGLRAGAGARAADAEQLRPAAVRRCAVGRERQARPLRLHDEDARPRHRRDRDAQPARRDVGGARGQEVDPRQPGRAQPGGAGLHRRAAQLSRRARRPRAGRDADRRPVDP